jgi:hypothetical protein
MSDKQVRGKHTHEYKLEAVRQVRAGQVHSGDGEGSGHPQGQSEQLGAPERQGRAQRCRRQTRK